MELRPLLAACQLDDLTRIDLGLEGDWSESVQVAWTRDAGSQHVNRQRVEHPSFKPSLELYFKDGWIGLHCFRRVGDKNLLDEVLLEELIGLVETLIGR